MSDRPRSLHHARFPPERLRDERTESITVCVPTRETAGTIGTVVDVLVALRERGAIDQVLVVDAASRDGTAEIAARRGAEVHQEADLLPGFGPPLGKGDAMWRALSVATCDIVCYVDGDTEGFAPRFACGPAGAVACEPGLEFVKGFFRRPFRAGGVTQPEGGGRVTELTARPLLRRFWPELGGLRQPLAGEVAARRELLERLPFATGYAVETAMLLDAYRAVGIEAIAEVDLEERQNRHQSLSALAPMADEVLAAATVRLEREGRLLDLGSGPAPVERPAMASLRARS